MLGNWFSSHNLYPATDNYWESDFFIFSDVSCSQMWFYGLSCQGTQALCTSHTTSSVAAPWQRPAENSPVCFGHPELQRWRSRSTAGLKRAKGSSNPLLVFAVCSPEMPASPPCP